MPEFDVGGYLSGDALIFNGVAGTKHPNGKRYTVPAPSAADELRMRRITQLQNTDDDAQDDDTSIADELNALLTGEDGKRLTVPQKLLGPVYDEMVADGVTPTHIDKLTALAMTNYGVNEYSARLVVAQAEGEALARSNRATRRAADKSTPRKPRASKPRAGSKSSPASSAPAPTKTAGSTPSPATSDHTRSRPQAKTA